MSAPTTLTPMSTRDASSQGLPWVEELPRQLDPWAAFRAVVRLPYPLFLDSALRHPTLGRYSYLAADPFAFVRSRRGQITWTAGEPLVPATDADPLRVLHECLARFRTPTVPGLPPFQGGAAGLFGYDLCHHIERLPRPPYDEFVTPDLAVGFYDWVLAFDHAEDRGWLISTGFPEADPACRRERARRRAHQVQALLASPPDPNWSLALDHSQLAMPLSALAPQYPMPQLPELTSNFSRAGFLAAVRRAVEYVHAGDCFQVNIAQRLLYPLWVHPVELYRKLRERNPATFAGYFDLGEFVIASASPERFLRLTPAALGEDGGGEVETRPIKGTRPRGRTPAEDQRQIDELRASPKDRAENIMIVDLLRNDLGRVCAYGSVAVPSLCAVESYRTVHHLVSVVRGRLRAGLGALDLMRAAFPGGSVTGAPKVRAMEIIAELEPTARGPYCGSLGFLGFDGALDTNILIRTFTAGRGWVQFPVGGGIVADSVPEREYEETLHKAEGLLRALA